MFFLTILHVREFRPSNVLTVLIALGHSRLTRIYEVVRGINTDGISVN